MAARKYDKYISHPARRQIRAEDDGRIVFDGRWIRNSDIGYDLNMGLQFVTRPFKNNNPCHTHNFQEFLAWYGGNPNDPDDFGAEGVLYMGEEMEKYVFTEPTIVSIPEGLPHSPLEMTKVDRPIIQVEIMLVGEGGTREPFKPGN